MSAGILSIPLNDRNDQTKITGILESIISFLPAFSFNLGSKIEGFLIRKAQKNIEKNLPVLNKLINDVESLSISDAKEGVELFELIIPIVEEIRVSLKNDTEINSEFRDTSLLFFEKFIELYHRIEEISKRDFEYITSLSTLKDDWNSEIDNHWDTY